MKEKWNIKKIDSTLIARLLSELEGCYYILYSMESEDADAIKDMITKYYTMYFKLKKEEK